MTSPQKLAHFVLATHRFEELIQWYTTLLDAKVRFNNGVLAFLSYDDEHHRLALANQVALGEPPRDAPNGTLEHVAFTYASLGDLLENYARVKPLGFKPYWCINHGITMSMYFGDPEGNQVEFQVDVFDDPEEANGFLMGPLFERNPIGVEYDPDEMLAKYRAGVPVETLMAFDPDVPAGPIRHSPERGRAATSMPG